MLGVPYSVGLNLLVVWIERHGPIRERGVQGLGKFEKKLIDFENKKK